MESAAIARQFKQNGIKAGLITPTAAAFIMYCVTMVMTREAATGLTRGHDEVLALMSSLLNQADQR